MSAKYFLDTECSLLCFRSHGAVKAPAGGCARKPRVDLRRGLHQFPSGSGILASLPAQISGADDGGRGHSVS